jgi:hypothetical protein
MSDSFVVFCPACRSTLSHHSEVPEHTRNWKVGTTDYVEHMPALRDYTCDNCSHEWSMGEIQS